MADEPIQTDTPEDGERVTETVRTTIYREYEGATPPGYDWPTHGGYLGCLLAVMFACLLAPLGYIAVGFLGAFLSQPLGAFGIAIAIVVTVVGYVAIFIGLVRLGWYMGKRFLREYPQPARPVWGEDDEDVVIVDADPPHVVDASSPDSERAPDGESETPAR